MPTKAYDGNSNNGGISHSNMAFWLYVVGIVIIVLSHLYLLNKGTMLSADDIYYHSLLNLFAACLLIGGWWMKSSEEEGESNSIESKIKHTAAKAKKTTTSWWDKLTGMEPKTSSRSNGEGYGSSGRKYDESQMAAEIQRFIDKAGNNNSRSRYPMY